MKLILLNGLPRSGKDTVADYIVNNYNYKKMAFADAIKDIVSKTFQISKQELDDYKNHPDLIKIKFADKERTFRSVIQHFGDEGIKPVFGNDVWADVGYRKIQELFKEGYNVVCSDFRFLVEYRDIPKHDVITVFIKDGKKLPLEGHVSDVELYKNDFKFDHIIENTGTLDELQQKVQSLLSKI